MASTILHLVLLLWSGLLVIAGAMLVIASQIGGLADAVQATSRPAAQAARAAKRPPGGAPTDGDLIIPMPRRARSQAAPARARAL